MGLGINRDRRVHSVNAYEVFQDAIFRETGISCSVFVRDNRDGGEEFVSIRLPATIPAEDRYWHFLVAKKAIKGMTKLDIRHDFLPELPKKA